MTIPQAKSAAASTEPRLSSRYELGDKLGAEITELYGYISAATYQLLVKIREFDESECWSLPGLCSCAHWLNFKCGIGMNAAREKVRVAHALKGLPKISAAFQRGELSYSKVRAMTRVAHETNEDYLLMIARHGTAYHVEKLVSSYRRARKLQEAETADKQHAYRDLTYRFDDNGCLEIHGRFPPEQGAMILKALQMAMDAVGRGGGAAPTEDIPDEPRVTAETSVAESTDCRRPSFPQQRADAISRLAEHYLNSDPDSERESASTADRYQVVVHVSAEALKSNENGCALDDANLSHIEDGPHVSAETSRRLACDCSRVTLLEDKDGEPLSIGRKSRSIPPAMRRALRNRDQGCRFPGCTHKEYVDGHHIHHWADGGETSMDNLVQLCRHHHRLVHEGGYGCKRLDDGKIFFTDPRDNPLAEDCTISANDRYLVVDDWLRETYSNLDVDETTCMTRFGAGDSIDWHLAVSNMFVADEGRLSC